MSNMEKMLQAMRDGDTTSVVPQSRMEACLKNCIEGCGCDGLPAPQSRLEVLLYALAEKMAGGAGDTGGENKLAQVVDRSITEITEADLQGATTIGQGAFRYCTSLKTATIPEGVTHLRDYSFASTGLTTIILPSTIAQIDTAFGSSRFIETFVVKAKTPPTLASGALNSFACPIIVPVGSGDLYKSATNWSGYADRIIEGDV